MRYFALASDSTLYDLGDHGDFEAADLTAEDMGIDTIWLADEELALQWAARINAALLDSIQQKKLLAGEGLNAIQETTT